MKGSQYLALQLSSTSSAATTGCQDVLLAGSPRIERYKIGAAEVAYSHSMVPGGLLVTSYTTRLTAGTSLITRLEIVARRS